MGDSLQGFARRQAIVNVCSTKPRLALLCPVHGYAIGVPKLVRRKVYHNNDRKSGYSISVTISVAMFVCQRISS